ncbi:MAG TPA: hypothetical protein VE783_02645 [Candidatus Limnocylindrales bacterium]|jgi:hypothetical protein|nr:hypothetical protein [Candidatus Limnocylindrales bacterium]
MQLKKLLATAAFVGMIVMLAASYSFSKDKDESVTLHGEITDSQCAFNVHSDARSHEWMIKKGVEGANDARSCTLHCVKDMGGKYVLVSKDEVYRLDDQVAAEKFAGLKVKAVGTIDSKTKTMHVAKLEADK